MQLRARYAANLAGEDTNDDDPDAETDNETATVVTNVEEPETRDTTHRANRQLLQIDRKLDLGEEGYVEHTAQNSVLTP